MKKRKLKEKIRLLEQANKELNIDVRNVINGKNVFITGLKYKAIDQMFKEIDKLQWSGSPTYIMEFGRDLSYKS